MDDEERLARALAASEAQFKEEERLRKLEEAALLKALEASKTQQQQQKKYIQKIAVPSKIYGLVVGKEFAVINELARRLNVVIFRPKEEKIADKDAKYGTLMVSADSMEILDDALSEIVLHISSFERNSKSRSPSPRAKRDEGPAAAAAAAALPAPVERPRPARDTRNIFVDNSNIVLSAQIMEDNSRDTRVRVNVSKLAPLLKGVGTKCGNMVVVGSKPSPTNLAWELWRQNGFIVMLVQRDADDHGEVGVDDTLHAKILATVTSSSEPQTLVMVTGDGNQHDGISNFVQCAVTAIMFKWKVELWGWQRAFSNRLLNLAQKNKEVTVRYLDEYRSEITFVKVKKEGGYGEQHKPKQGKHVQQQPQQPPQQPPQQQQQLPKAHDECIICMAAPRAVALLPCGHKIACQNCSLLLAQCPVCDQLKTGTVRID